jgi:hypothetical protein
VRVSSYLSNTPTDAALPDHIFNVKDRGTPPNRTGRLLPMTSNHNMWEVRKFNSDQRSRVTTERTVKG